MPSFGAISVLRSCRSCADAISQSGPRGRKERQPLCPCCQVLRLPRGPRQDRGREATHHPTKRGTQQDQPPRCCQPIGNGSPQGKRERGKGNATSERAGATRERGKEERSEAEPATSPQAHKKRVPPPYCKEQTAASLITNSRQKISKKSPWGGFEKIFGKIFRGNVSGERKTPCVISTEGGIVSLA